MYGIDPLTTRVRVYVDLLFCHIVPLLVDQCVCHTDTLLWFTYLWLSYVHLWRVCRAYIGLRRSASDCTCEGVSADNCQACRASWLWPDSTPMSWWSWKNEEPNAFECGQLQSDGWADADCSVQNRYICEKGKLAIILTSKHYHTVVPLFKLIFCTKL